MSTYDENWNAAIDPHSDIIVCLFVHNYFYFYHNCPEMNFHSIVYGLSIYVYVYLLTIQI